MKLIISIEAKHQAILILIFTDNYLFSKRQSQRLPISLHYVCNMGKVTHHLNLFFCFLIFYLLFIDGLNDNFVHKERFACCFYFCWRLLRWGQKWLGKLMQDSLLLNKAIMKKRIAGELLRLHQAKTLQKPSPHLLKLHEIAYSLIADMVTDIKRPFTRVCIHGRSPHIILPFLHQHNQRFGVKKNETKVTVVDHMRNSHLETLMEEGFVKQVRYVDNQDGWLYQEEEFDLLITSLTTHHANFEEDLLGKYLRTLKADGALIGSTFAQGTLSQLYWAYLLAQNERHGGMSPKVMQMPSLGQLGNSLTMAKYQMATVVAHDETLQFQSVVDLLTLLQQIGQSGYLRGRRKGVYKDLLLAAAALYSSQFGIQGERVRATLALSKFIGWKKHASQPKTLSPGPHVGSVQFSDQLRKFGDEVQNYVIEEGVDEPRKIK